MNFQLLNNTRKVLGAGGKHRISLTLPSIVFQLYQLLRVFAEDKEAVGELQITVSFIESLDTFGPFIFHVHFLRGKEKKV